MRVSSTDLRAALKATASAITTRPTAPILAGVRITFDGERQAEFRTTDWENWISTRVSAEGGDPVDVVVSHRTLAAIAKLVSARPVDLTVADNRLHVAAGGAKWSVPIIGAVEDCAQWPSMPAKYGTMTATALQAALRAVAPAAGREEALPEFHVVTVEPHGDGYLRLSTCDRYRLHAALAEFTGVGDEFICLPIAAQLDRAAGELNGDLALYADERAGLFGVEDERSTVLVKVMDAKAFPVDTFLAKSGSGTAHTILNPDSLIAALNAVSPVLAERTAVTLLVTAEGITAKTSGVGGGCEIPVEVEEHVGRGLSVIVNPAFLATALKAVGGDSVRLDWDSPTRPVVVTGPDARAAVMVVSGLDSGWLP